MTVVRPKHKKIVLIFKEKKLPGLTTSADFYEYVDFARKKYFGSKQTILIRFLKGLDDASIIQKDALLRDISIMNYANQIGSISVDWDRFFKQNTRDLLKLSKETIKYINNMYPEIIEEWNSEMIKAVKEQEM